MILIISDPKEKSTTDVINWLRFFKQKYQRINYGDLIEIKNSRFNGLEPVIEFTVNGGNVISTDEISSYWYRRGALTFSLTTDYGKHMKERSLLADVVDNMGDETKTLRDLLYFIIENKENKLGGFYTKENNKLIHLSIAQSMGIDVPNTIVCTDKKELKDFYKKNSNEIIIKAIGNSFSHIKHIRSGNDRWFANYTNVVNQTELNDFPDTFPPTLLQSKINKKFELRIFYLKERFFSMAIFSQNDEKTKVDFRRYNRENENHRVSFALPNKIKAKLIKFMNKVDLNTGSIDMIYTVDGKYIFLEVNPVGQFGMVSHPCNYNLEKEIALELSK